MSALDYIAREPMVQIALLAAIVLSLGLILMYRGQKASRMFEEKKSEAEHRRYLEKEQTATNRKLIEGRAVIPHSAE